MRQLLVILGLAVLLIPPAAGDDKEKSDTDKLQGEWVAVSMELSGRKAADDYVKKTSLVIKGEDWQQTLNGTKAKDRKFKLDPSKSPKEIDFELTDPKTDKAARLTRGIYKFEGDQLILCRQIIPERERPKEFKTTDKDGAELVVFKRAERK